MFRHVIVGVDVRTSGRDAIAPGRLLIAPQERLALAHVYESGPAPDVGKHHLTSRELRALPTARVAAAGKQRSGSARQLQ